MGFDRFVRTGSWNFFNLENWFWLKSVILNFPHEHLLLITYFGKPIIDLLPTFKSEKQD